MPKIKPKSPVPVIPLEHAHAIKSCGLKGSYIANYVIAGYLQWLSVNTPGTVVYTIVRPIPGKPRAYYGHCTPTPLGWAAMKLAFDKAEGRF